MIFRLFPAAILLVLAILAGISVTGLFIPAEGICPGCNVLLITIDTLRADHLSSYGYFSNTSPRIDSLAGEGLVFDNAFSQIPHTPPSHWSILSGLYPFRHGRYVPKDDGAGVLTLPEILRDEGYITAGFISSQMLNGFIDEFDHFNSLEGRTRLAMNQRADRTSEMALEWLEGHSGERFFLWIHYFDPHSPYSPPEGMGFNYSGGDFYSGPGYGEEGITKGRTIREDIGKYDGEILYADGKVGEVLDLLEEAGVLNSTVVVILSDHGECFGEHNFSDFGYEEAGPCLFHGKTLYQEEVHIPLIMRVPGIGPERVSDVVESVDIFPTVLEVLGMGGRESDGKSLLQVAEDGGKGYAFLQTRPWREGLSTGVVMDGWKFVRMFPSELDLENEIAEQEGAGIASAEGAETAGRKGGEEKKLFFNIDEGEGENLIGTGQETERVLEGKLKEIVAGSADYRTIEIDAETERLLRGLGYMD